MAAREDGPTRAGGDGAPARIVLRPVATSLPLGFLALAGGTLLVAGLELGWIDAAERRQVALILLAFVAPLQIVASVLGFLSRDVGAGTAMGLLTGTWLSVALVLESTAPGTTSDALGTLLVLAAVALLVPASAAAGAKLVPAAVIGLSAVRFAVTGAAELSGEAVVDDAAGIVGLALCALAVYAALALALEDVRGATVLPVGRRGEVRRLMEGGEGPGVDREAGVRRQL